MENAPQRKSVKKWVILLLVPVAALLTTALVQFIVRFVLSSTAGDTGPGPATNGSGDVLRQAINIISILVGVVSVSMLLLTPLWLEPISK